MFLKNPVVYIQFHPVVYMVKLNIEMSMASLIVRLAQGKTENDAVPDHFDSSTGPSHSQSDRRKTKQPSHMQSFQLSSQKRGMKSLTHSRNDSDESLGQIHCRTDLAVTVEQIGTIKEDGTSGTSSRSSQEQKPYSVFGDEMPLKGNVHISGKAV
jgi:hypothetical protein